MFGLSGFATKIVIALACMAAIGVAVTFGISSLHQYGQERYDAGVKDTQLAERTKATELLKKRDELNGTIKRTATKADLCSIGLGGKWVPDDSPDSGHCE